MKKFKGILFLCALAMTISAQADENWSVRCKNISEAAEAIMDGRQAGLPMSVTMELTDGNGFLERMVMAAYEIERYETKDMQERMVNTFRDRAYMMCAKQLRDKN